MRLLLSRQIQADVKLTKADIVFAESCHEFTASGLKKIEVLHPLCSEMREGWRRRPNQFTSPYAVTDSDECLRTWGDHNLFMFFAELFQFDLQLYSHPSPALWVLLQSEMKKRIRRCHRVYRGHLIRNPLITATVTPKVVFMLLGILLSCYYNATAFYWHRDTLQIAFMRHVWAFLPFEICTSSAKPREFNGR